LPTASGWYTDGNQIKQHTILPSKGITLKSISWFGFETANYVVHGLWVRKMDDLLNLTQNLGFNSIRIPWSNDIIKNPMPNGINYTLNPELVNKKSLEVLDYMIDRCKFFKLYVILDRHRPNKDGQSELWYTNQVSESKWIEDWKTMAIRYRPKDYVIAADLHN
jgi:endoglucanase